MNASKRALLISVVFFLPLSGCATNKPVTVFSSEDLELDNVLVIPLYNVFKGLAVGPEGWGPRKDELIVARPFLLQPGDNINKDKIRSKLVPLCPIPPYIVVGKGYSPFKWLLMKRGYRLRMITRYDVYSDEPITLGLSEDTDAIDRTILKLLMSPPDVQYFQTVFDIAETPIEIVLDENDIALLKEQMSSQRGLDK